MATEVFTHPEAVGDPPEFDAFMKEGGGFDSNAYFAACNEWTEKVSKWARENTHNAKLTDLIGYVYRYQVADGYAQYVVLSTSPKIELIHLPLVDAYQMPIQVERGLRVSDIRSAKKFDDTWKKLAAENKAQKAEKAV